MIRLSELTTLRLGGPAGAVVEARSEDELVEAARGDDVLLVAGGSNLVIADEGWPGTVVRVLTRGVEEREADGRVELTVAAGEEWEPFVARCVAEGLAGVESLSGIPGSIGATPIQNVGAYGQEVAETIVSVRALERATGEVARPRAGGVRLRLPLERVQARPRALGRAGGDVRARAPRAVGPARLRRAGAHARRASRARARRSPRCARRCSACAAARGWCSTRPTPTRSPPARSSPTRSSAPTTFAALEQRAERPPRFPEPDGRVKTSAAWLIERAGFQRGHGNPEGIAISSKHTLALTNRGGGTTAELLALAREIAAGVEERFGVRLEPEPTLVGVDWP